MKNTFFSESHFLTKDENGNPRTLYHGSLSSFESFDPSRGEHSMFGRGIYLTSSADDAGRYASKDVSVNIDIPGKAEFLQRELGISYKEARDVVTEGTEQVYPVFVCVKRPIIIGTGVPLKADLRMLINTLKIAGHKSPERAAKRFISLSNFGKNEDDDRFLFHKDSEIKRLMDRYMDPSIVQLDIIGNTGMRELMISQNADGIILANAHSLYSWMEQGSAHYFVRSNNQVLSVFSIEASQKKPTIESEIIMQKKEEITSATIDDGSRTVSAIFSDYSKTFTTPVENYCIAAIAQDGASLDFSWCDAAIRDEVFKKLDSKISWMSPETYRGEIEKIFSEGDHIKTAWHLSEAMAGVKGIKPKEMTVDAFQSIYVDYPHGSPRHSKEKSPGGLFGSSVVDGEGQTFLRYR